MLCPDARLEDTMPIKNLQFRLSAQKALANKPKLELDQLGLVFVIGRPLLDCCWLQRGNTQLHCHINKLRQADVAISVGVEAIEKFLHSILVNVWVTLKDLARSLL